MFSLSDPSNFGSLKQPQKNGIDRIITQTKNKRVSLMVWGCFYDQNRGPFTPLIVESVDKHIYVKMLDYLLFPGIARVQNTIGSSMFQQDKAPIHKAQTVQAFFDQNHITVEDWPAISPDLNPIEHVLVELKR
jgi:hypothetical protein